ncbi:MAG: GNAT family N-acetyltransferase [Lachnospiraceae bacterium]|nr:GNAT family N-acetyltransferase [Lachnospiraceae bacterium]
MKLKNVSTPFDWWKIKKLYKEAFPANERKPFAMIKKKHATKEADVWMIMADGGFVGFAITMNVKDRVLLDYFAIYDRKRGQGYGSKALKLLQEFYHDVRFFLEIERVDVDAENLPDRKRRKAFYLANGMTELPVKCMVFGVAMELLGYQCEVSFEEYFEVYDSTYGPWVSKNIIRMEEQTGEKQ